MTKPLTIEDLEDLLNEIVCETNEMAKEMNRKFVDWKLVNHFQISIDKKTVQFHKAQNDVREREIAKIRDSVLQVPSKIPTSSGLSDQADSRAGADLPGGNAPVGVAVL